MIFSIVTWLILSCSALELVYLLYLAWSSTRGPKLVLGDVIHFLYPVDSSLLASLVDPAADFELRWSLSPRSFREEQRRRMRLYRELLGRMAHNSAVLAEFDNAMRGNVAGPGSKLQEAAVKVRLYCMFSRGRLRLWLWLPNAFGVVVPPRLARLRIAANLDGLQVYEELKMAAAEAFAQLRPAELEALTHNL
jgi:hypothetical protein